MARLNKRLLRLSRISVIFACFPFVGAPRAYGQGRMNDKDLQALMQNLRDDTKSFKSQFYSAIGKSTIRKTTREKDAKSLVDRFQKQTETMLNNFKRTKQGDADVQTALTTAQQIDELVYGLRLNPQVTSSWDKIESELEQIAGVFGLPSPRPGHYPRADVTPTANAETGAPSCLVAVGAERSQRLVEECLAVSPATNPPCNSQNSCVMIIDEIRRGCGLLGRNAPAYCNEYR